MNQYSLSAVVGVSTYPDTDFVVCSFAILLIAIENALACRPSCDASRSISSCFVPDGARVRFRHS